MGTQQARRVGDRLPPHWAMVANIVASYADTPAHLRLAGRKWYSDARTFVRALVAGTGLTVEQGAGIVAALSPRATWEVNQNFAIALVAARGQRQAPGVSTTPNRAAAWDIAQGADVWDRLRGPKVRDFAAAILGDCETPVIDSWAYKVAVGDLETDVPNLQRRRYYQRIQEAYRDAATVVGETPAHMQAIAGWVKPRGRAA